MNIADYPDAVKRTCVTTGPEDTIKLALIGLIGELGEIADPLKKHFWQGHEVDKSHLQEEIGDLMWYLATLCNGLEVSLSETLIQNIGKLFRRYPMGFSPQQSINHDTWQEAECSTSRGIGNE
jgi:NTP pyrophosphatase (non-canonical NTP hydrolase)